MFDEWTRRGDYGCLDNVFDKVGWEWLNAEDTELYKVQQESRGQVGYSTRKYADLKTIHPSKSSTPASMSAHSFDAVQGSDTESEPEDLRDKSYQPDDAHSSTGKHHKTVIAMNLVTGTKISTSKAAKICQKLSEEGVNIPPPSQPAVYKALFRGATQVSLIRIRAVLIYSTGQCTVDRTHYSGLT